MDLHTSEPLAKNQKLLEEPNGIRNDDRISKLPDGLLCHILSFISTRYALRTSILSTRWKYIWKSIPDLDFSDMFPIFYLGETFINNKSYVKFVNRILILRDRSNIRKFRLVCRMKCTESHINTWISAAISRNVQELDLHISIDDNHYVREPVLLPFSLFSCESLRVLILRLTYSDTKTFNSIWLPNLKILHLDGLVFWNDKSTEQFFSGCPVLEQLTVCEYAWAHLNAVSISLSKLKNLTILGEGHGVHHGVINIAAPNLLSFKYNGAMRYRYALSNLSSVFDAHVVVSELLLDREAVGRRVVELLGSLSQIQELTLCKETIETLYAAEDLLAGPTLPKLQYLEVTGNFANRLVPTIMGLLKICPMLESLALSRDYSLAEQCNLDDLVSVVPQCFISTLKEIKLGTFRGMEHELSLLSFLLKNAVVLKKMNVIFSENLSKDLERLEMVKEQVLTLSRGLSGCAIMFS